MPPLLVLSSEIEYRNHFEKSYCRVAVFTHDGIRVFFKISDFEHAFYESCNRNGIKDTTLSKARAQRMDWIGATLLDGSAVRYQGWIKKEHRYDPARCVSVVYGDFVVVLRFGKRRDGNLRANFITCYDADNSIKKIRQSPLWNLADCIKSL